MQYLENLSVRSRLIALALAGLLLSLIIGGSGLFGLVTVNRHLSDMYEDNLVPVGDVGNANMQAIYHNRALLAYVIEQKQPEMDKIGVKMAAHEAKMNQLLDKYRKTDLTPKEIELLAKFDKAWPPYIASAKKVMAFSYADKNTEAMEEFNGNTVAVFQVVDDLLSDIYDLNIALGKQNNDAGQVATSWAMTIAVALIITGVLGLLAMSYAITRSITNVLGGEPADLSVEIEAIAQGDLSRSISALGVSESSLRARLAFMQANLKQLVTSVRGSAENVSNASREIAQGNSDLSGRTEEQASSLEQTASSMEQLGATSQHNAENSVQANQLAAVASGVASEGGGVVAKVVATMQEINESSRKISDIISVIEGIAFQTNILALNAAVEAARAGDQGRGFAVVASEVRALAGRSADAAKEIKGLINASVERVEAGTALVDIAGTTMAKVVDSIQRVADIVGEIRSASSEQSSGVMQVSQAVEQIDQITQQNAALVEEMAAAASSLESQASGLMQQVAVFKLGASDGLALPGGQPASLKIAAKPVTKIVTKAAAKTKPLDPVALPKIQPVKKASTVTANAADGEWDSF